MSISALSRELFTSLRSNKKVEPTPPDASLAYLDELTEKLRAEKLHKLPDNPDLDAEIDRVAQVLLDQIEKAFAATRKQNLGIRAVWTALNSFDVARSEPTIQLTTAALNNFHGDAQTNLRTAYITARDSGDDLLPILEDVVKSSPDQD